MFVCIERKERGEEEREVEGKKEGEREGEMEGEGRRRGRGRERVLPIINISLFYVIHIQDTHHIKFNTWAPILMLF